MNREQEKQALQLLKQAERTVQILGREFSAPNFTDRHGDGPNLLKLAAEITSFVEEVEKPQIVRYVNLWRRRGVLGSKPSYVLSTPYFSPEEAKTGREVPPDVGWEFIKTFTVMVKS